VTVGGTQQLLLRAILHTLPAGSFAAVVSGRGGTIGEALVEVYEAN
jgi:hypothetical protein